MTIKLALVIAAITLSLFQTSSVRATDAAEQLTSSINRVVPIMRNTPRADLQMRGLPESARKLIIDRFDFFEMTKRSLDWRWNSLTRAQQKQFVDAYSKWQLVNYGKVLLSSHGEAIEFIRERRHGTDAAVETRIVSRYRDDLPIDYRLHNIRGTWKVYDMVIDNVDLIQNVRAQFERVIGKSSIDELLQKIKDHGQPS
jgi:phospholipid transport system substrate-binding protein